MKALSTGLSILAAAVLLGACGQMGTRVSEAFGPDPAMSLAPAGAIPGVCRSRPFKQGQLPPHGSDDVVLTITIKKSGEATIYLCDQGYPATNPGGPGTDRPKETDVGAVPPGFAPVGNQVALPKFQKWKDATETDPCIRLEGSGGSSYYCW